ncbi:MAG: flotillin family protein [Bacteroidales bacterium]|nr:flotillin family protein [Bacteroidales bacterium]
MTTLSILLSAGGLIGFLFILVLFLVFLMFILIVRRYKRCPSDKILVIYGQVGKNEGGTRTAKVIHGGAAFVWPVFQDYEFMDLTPIPIIVDLRGALSNQNIRVNVPARFMVGISTEIGVMQNAAERLLGLTLDNIHDLASDIIFGQLRVVIATMKIEEINSDREKFLANVTEAVEHELKKIGLKLINVNVTDITDDDGYIEALGKEATAHAINEAKKLVAEKDRDGAIGQANARREQRIQVASANSQAEIGEADAEQSKRVSVAQANATAVSGENLSQTKIAESESKKRVDVSEAMKNAEIAEKTNQAEAKEKAYNAEKLAEISRAERDKATQYANIVVPQEIDKQKIEIAAEAEAERIRRIAKGQADGKFMDMEAMAKGTFQILSKQAEGFKQIVSAAGNNSTDAIRLLIADKLEDLVKIQVEAIKNIKIDKVTVWENGGSKDGNTSTSNFLKGMVGSIPPLEELFNMAGMEIPNYLGKKKVVEDIDFEEEAKKDESEAIG